jgi:hypothetical protein
VTTDFILKLIGYSGSALIALSLMMSSILRLRVINMIGGATFSLYGFLIGSYPVGLLNGFIVLVNVYHVNRMLRTKQYFQLLSLRPDSDYLRYFLKFYETQIRGILPGFEYRPGEGQLTLFILRDCNPVGVFIADEGPAGTLNVRLDFAVPRYRDLKIGRFLFVDQASFFRERGIREIVISPRTPAFGAYLLKVGFEPASPGDQRRFRIRFAE